MPTYRAKPGVLWAMIWPLPTRQGHRVHSSRARAHTYTRDHRRSRLSDFSRRARADKGYARGKRGLWDAETWPPSITHADT